MKRPDAKGRAAIAEFARGIIAARRQHNITVPTAARQIGISPDALRRIESGKSQNCRGETLFMVLHWAYGLGYRQFAGWRLSNDPGLIPDRMRVALHRRISTEEGRNPVRRSRRAD